MNTEQRIQLIEEKLDARVRSKPHEGYPWLDDIAFLLNEIKNLQFIMAATGITEQKGLVPTGEEE